MSAEHVGPCGKQIWAYPAMGDGQGGGQGEGEGQGEGQGEVSCVGPPGEQCFASDPHLIRVSSRCHSHLIRVLSISSASLAHPAAVGVSVRRAVCSPVGYSCRERAQRHLGKLRMGVWARVGVRAGVKGERRK